LATTIFEAAELDSDLLSALQDGSRTHASIAREFGFGETSVRRWRSRNDVGLNTEGPQGPATTTTTTADQVTQKGTIDVTPDGAQVNNVVVTSPINTDWSSVFALFNLSADDFEVVDDTVRMSTWQQSKRTDDGERDTIQLWAYSARFRRISKDYVAPEVVDGWKRLLISERPALTVDEPLSLGGIYPMFVADPQLGKKGTEEAVENWKRGVYGHLQAAKRLLPDGLHIGFQGDEHEGVVNNYTNQPHTVELNFTRQLELDYDMRVWTIREALGLGIPVSASSVISNHGEWTRNGGKDVVTTRSDNSSTHIARQVKKLFDDLEPFTGQHVEWTIGEGEPHVLVDLAGIKTYMSHGYIEKGKGGSVEIKTKNAMERQILGKTETLGDVRLFITSHYHHFYMQEFEGRTQFGTPALEAERSSEYMLDQYGVWSPPGMLGMLVGRDKVRGWSDLAVY
jgi:hypothetical protein